MSGPGTWQERVEAELRELELRRQHLTAFMLTDAFRALADGQRALLLVQEKAMGTYAAILRLRLDLDELP